MIALVALGSNLGDRRTNLDAGLLALGALGKVTASPLTTETPDESGTGPAYLNTVAILDSELEDPRALLEALLQAELRLGRDRSAGRNAPRTLDLDLIAVQGFAGRWHWPAPEGLPWTELDLQLPHPRAHLRSFVLDPWRALQGELPPELRPPEA